MSAVADIGWVGRPEGGMADIEVAAIFGSRTAMLGTDNDLFEVLKRFAPGAIRPKLWMRCGVGDELVSTNREFKARLEAAGGWKLDYREQPGVHDWNFWLGIMPELLDFFTAR
ncbi:hypothetical protein SDC9_150530 [bioreactor metagenome]|uniref:Carbohydrate acetyl esterase/feruloyl esterase n=1 Tax=bioreactor metagenome TaxID=1076179 RepID=A0A645ES01_9ZZZZ